MKCGSLHQFYCIALILIYSICTESLLNTKSQIRQSTKLYAGVPVVPYYPTKGSRDYQWMDIYNALGRERTLFVGRFLDEENCNQLISSLIWLQGQSDKDPITMYFNVPGANIKPAFAVFDTMRRMKCPLITINTGLTVGMGALLCAVGTPGKRYAMPNSRFLMAKTGLEDGYQGQAIEISLAVREVMKDNEKVMGELARLCGQPLVKLQQDMKRDFYLTAPEAAAYGVVDEVMQPKQPVKMMKYRGSDDAVINFGHFCEVRKVKEGPNDVLVTPNSRGGDDAFDEYAARQLAKSGRPDPQKLKSAASRYAGLRCKPPGLSDPNNNNNAGNTGGNDGNDGKKKKDMFKNTGVSLHVKDVGSLTLLI